MVFYQDIESIIFNRHEHFDCDQLIVLSGYLGPNPVEKLRDLPFETTVIYGMYGSEGIRKNLHESLVRLNHDISNIDIKYSTVPVHSKCYIWLRNGDVIYALIGSANFSVNGLTTPYKEILAETSRDSFAPLARYVAQITNSSIPCEDGQISVRRSQRAAEDESDQGEANANATNCRLFLFDLSTGSVPSKSGLNWGMARLTGSHVHIDDAYIPILKDNIRRFPHLFPPKLIFPREHVEEGRRNRHNEAIEIIWDDGTTMRGLLEGNQNENGTIFPKQIASHPLKRSLGQYIRRRLGVPSGQEITNEDLDRYGRRDIEISLQAEGIYLFDFSVPIN
jgi:hypothetical protein